MPSGPEPGQLLLDLPAAPTSARLARVFVSEVLEALDLPAETIEDVKVVVSDLVTGLTTMGAAAALQVALTGDGVTIEGNWVEEAPRPAPLLGEAIRIEARRWQILLPIG